MNYNDFFESALSAAYKKAPMTDDDTFMRIVKERAKNMKKNDNVKHMHFTEITPEYAEPKKSHKALNVFAGVAGTAAVLTGAVFGLNWLNEHGGLKGPDVQGAGAGYHEDSEPAQSAAVPEETEPAVTEENKDEETRLACAPSGIDERYFKETDASFNFGDIQAHISGYSYDGLMLIVKYELTYPEEIADYPSNIPTLIDRREATGELPFWNNPRYSRYTAFDGNKVEIERYILNRNLENSFDTLWIDESLDPAERLSKAKADADSDELIFTVHRTVTDNPVIASDVSEYTLPDGTCIYPNNVFISAYGIFIDFEHIDLPAWEKLCSNMETLPITLIMSDGSEIFVTGGSKMGLCSDHDDSINYVGGLFDETIDTRNVKSVNIFGEPFVTFEKETLSSDIDRFEPVTVAPEENRNYLTDAHVDTDECSIDMNWLTFDGITLRLQYDVTFRNGLPADGSIPIIVACGDNEIRYTTHGTRVDKLGVDENKVSYIGEVVYNRIMTDEPIKLRFRHFTRAGEEEMISWLDTEAGVGIITPDELPDVNIAEYEINKETAMKWGSKLTVEKATVCRDSVMFTLKYSNLYKQGFNLHDTYLAMNDGSKVDLEGIEDQGGTASSDTAEIWQHYELSEPIDPSAVAQIYVCGECIYDAQETLPEETAE